MICHAVRSCTHIVGSKVVLLVKINELRLIFTFQKDNATANQVLNFFQNIQGAFKQFVSFYSLSCINAQVFFQVVQARTQKPDRN